LVVFARISDLPLMPDRKFVGPKVLKRVKKPSSGTTIAVHLPSDLRDRVDEAAIKSGLSKQDFYRLCLEIGMIFWDEAGSIAFTLHDAGKNPESIAKIRAICADYGLYLPEEVTALRAAEKPE
jgi:hypothetical protein